MENILHLENICILTSPFDFKCLSPLHRTANMAAGERSIPDEACIIFNLPRFPI